MDNTHSTETKPTSDWRKREMGALWIKDGKSHQFYSGFLKTINSAVSNLISKGEDVDMDHLMIKSITVDGGPVFKRWKPAAYGRAVPRLKRTSHLTVVISSKES